MSPGWYTKRVKKDPYQVALKFIRCSSYILEGESAVYPSITTRLVYPIDLGMPWGPDETPERVLALARLETLSDYRDIDKGFVDLSTSWSVGPQNNPILDITITHRSGEGLESDLVPSSAKYANLLELLGKVFSTNLDWFWQCQKQSLSVQTLTF